MADRFELAVRTEICRLDSSGYQTGDRLTMGQDLVLKAGDMLELFGILSMLNDLVKDIREGQADSEADAHRG